MPIDADEDRRRSSRCSARSDPGRRREHGRGVRDSSLRPDARSPQLAREIERARSTPWSRRCPDLYGRLVGKRITRALLPRRDRRRTACTCATTCSRATWRWTRRPATRSRAGRPGYGDLHAVPDLGDAAARGLARRHRARALRRRIAARRRAGRGRAARRSCSASSRALAERGLHREDGQRARVLPVPRRLRGRAREGLSQISSRRGDYVEDYHVLSSTLRRGRDRRDPRARRRLRRSPSSSARASGGRASTRSTCATREALEMADRHVRLQARREGDRGARGPRRSPSWRSSTTRSPAAACTSTRASGRRRRRAGLRGRRRALRGHARAALGRVPPLPRRAARARARARAAASRPTVNSYKRYRAGTFAPTRHRLELRQPHGRLPRRGPTARRCASSAGSPAPTRIPTSRTRRCWPPASTASSSASSRVRRSRATSTRAPDLPAGPAHAARGAPRVRAEPRSCARVRRRRDGAPAPLRAHRAAPGRARGHRRGARALLRADLSGVDGHRVSPADRHHHLPPRDARAAGR